MAKKSPKKRTRGLPKIIAGSQEEKMGMFFESLVESYVLADEPEFKDLYFDEEKVFASVEKTHWKYEKKLLAAEKKGGEELEFLQDDMRAEAIDRILTNHIRKEILHRLDLLIERLRTSPLDEDIEKYMMSTAVHTVITTTEIPWGITSLIVEIFQRSLKLDELDDGDNQLFTEIEDLLGEELPPEEILLKLDDPAFMEKLERTIDTNSDMYQRLSAYTDRMVNEFIDALWEGSVELVVFSEDEVIGYFERLQERFEAAGIDLKDRDAQETGEILTSTLDEYITEIVTPIKYLQIKKELKKLSNEWAQKRHKHAGALLGEIQNLEDDALADNFLIRAIFSSQIKNAFPEPEEDKKLDQTPRKKTRRGRPGRRKKK